jgi:hypothetical protein
MTKKTLHNNIVEDYFKNNTDVKISIAKLKKQLNISDSQVYYLAMNSSEVRMIKPIEVGSNKKKLAVFTYESIEERKIREEKDTVEKANRDAKRESSNMVDIVDTVDMVDIVDTVDMVDIVDIVDIVDNVDIVDITTDIIN